MDKILFQTAYTEGAGRLVHGKKRIFVFTLIQIIQHL